MSADSIYRVSSWKIRTVPSSGLAGLFRWFALPILSTGIAVETRDFFGGTGYSELAALDAGVASVRRRGLKPR